VCAEAVTLGAKSGPYALLALNRRPRSFTSTRRTGREGVEIGAMTR
jgi:hypothetical protein